MKKISILLLSIIPFCAFCASEYHYLGPRAVRVDHKGNTIRYTPMPSDQADKERALKAALEFAKEHPGAAALIVAGGAAIAYFFGGGSK